MLIKLNVHGSCQCGAIAYKATVDPSHASVCHCKDCQKLSGAPFRASVPTNVEDFTLLRGTPKAYIKTAESGNLRSQVFCGDCGSPIYSADAEGAKVYTLRIGPIDERDELPPRRQIWCQSALHWSGDLLALPKIHKQM